MDSPEENRLREMRQTFDLAGADDSGRLVPISPPVLRAKVFKSGNSLALRLPKALGLEAGIEMELAPDGRGGHTLRRANAPKRKFNIAKVAGSAKGLNYVDRGNRTFDARPSAADLRAAK